MAGLEDEPRPGRPRTIRARFEKGVLVERPDESGGDQQAVGHADPQLLTIPPTSYVTAAWPLRSRRLARLLRQLAVCP